jgi:enolase
MIIKEIKRTKGFLLIKSKIILDTTDGSFDFEYALTDSEIIKLNSKIKDFKIETSEDFVRLKNSLKSSDKEYSFIEEVLLKNIKKPWKLFGSVSQIPRPINVVYRKETGIKEFVVFSLNTKSFDTAYNSGLKVVDYVNKKSQGLTEEQILMLIKEAIDREHAFVDFELRIGVVFNNFVNGKYEYGDKKLNTKEQLEYIAKLIENYSVCYVENPFSEKDLDSYKALANDYRRMCLVCMNSKINEYSKPIKNKVLNTVVAKFDNVVDFQKEVLNFKDAGLNVVFNADIRGIDAAIGLGIPLVKIYDDAEGNKIAKKITEIQKQITEEKTQSI